MVYNPKYTVPEIPDSIIKNLRIAGNTEVVDALLKRVVLFNRETMQLIAAKNVKPDNSWEMFATDQGEGNHILIGVDEGENFNLDGFDRVSLGPVTFEFDMADYEHLLSSSEAFYVWSAFYTDMTNFPAPVMMSGELSFDENTVQNLYFVEDSIMSVGHFENEVGEYVPVGTVDSKLKLGGVIIIGGLNFTIEAVTDRGLGDNTVKLDCCIAASPLDVLGDGSCVCHMPMFMSWIDIVGSSTIIPSSELMLPFTRTHRGYGGVEVKRDLTGVKTITALTDTDALPNTSYVHPLITIPGVIEVGWKSNAEYLYVTSLIDGSTTTYSQGTYQTRISIVFDVTGVKFYFDNYTTPKRTLPAHTLSSEDTCIIFGQSVYNSSAPVKDTTSSLWDLQMFNKVITSAEITTLTTAGAMYTYASVPVPVTHIPNQYHSGSHVRVLNDSITKYTSNFDAFSPFYGSAFDKLIFEKRLTMPRVPMSLLETSGNVIRVPEDYTNVQYAIDAAKSGDIIHFAAGDYGSGYTIQDKVIHLCGDLDIFGNPTTRFTRWYCPLHIQDTKTMTSDYNKYPELIIFGIEFTQSATNNSHYCVMITAYERSVFSVRFINCNLYNPIGNALRFPTAFQTVAVFQNCDFDALYHTYDVGGQTICAFEKSAFKQNLNMYNPGPVTLSDYVVGLKTPGSDYGSGENFNGNARFPVSYIDVSYVCFSIPGGSITEDIKNVKIPIDLSLYPDIFSKISEYEDISVVFKDGSFLPISIENFDKDLGTGLLWVSLPEVLEGEATDYALIYPFNASGTNLINYSVWPDQLVEYHMESVPIGTGSCKDAAGIHDATPVDMSATNMSVAILGSNEYSFDGITEHLNTGNLFPELTTEGGIELVFRTSQTQGMLVSQDADGLNTKDTNLAIGKPTGISNTVTDGHLVFESKGPGVGETNHVVSTSPVNDNDYHHVGLSWYRENLGLVLDGIAEAEQVQYPMWDSTGSLMIGTDGTLFFSGTMTEVLISKEFKKAEFHRLVNASISNSLFSYSHDFQVLLPDRFVCVSVVFDLINNWGGDSMGFRQIDFYLNRIKYNLIAGEDFYVSSTTFNDATTDPKYGFDVTTSYVDGYSENAWMSLSEPSNQRVIITFVEPLAFDEIRINNFHGTDAVGGNYNLDFGIKNFKMIVSPTEVTSLIFDSEVSDGILAYLGTVNMHSSTNERDDQALSNFKGLTNPALESHKFWRMYISYNLNSSYCELATLEFRSVSGSADQATGGTATANQVWSGYSSDLAFDGNDGTWWITSTPNHGWIAYEFPTPVWVGEIYMRPRPGYLTYMPRDFEVQYSDDGLIWHTANSWENLPSWPAEGDTFRVSDVADGIPENVPVIQASFTASKDLRDVPLRIDLEATGLDPAITADALASPYNMIISSTSTYATDFKTEKLPWVASSKAPIWVSVPFVLKGENTIDIKVGEAVNSNIDDIGSVISQEVFKDFEAVYHLCQDPSTGIKDSTGNNSDAATVNMDASNLVNGELVFNGTDEVLNLGTVLADATLESQVHIGFKTLQADAPLVFLGDEGLYLNSTGKAVIDTIGVPESLSVLNTGTSQAVTVANDNYKRDFFVNGIDQLPDGMFGSTGSTDVLFGKHYTDSGFFSGDIVNIRIHTEAPKVSKLSLHGKVWNSDIELQADYINLIPIFSFDQDHKTYKIWDGAWRSVVSMDDSIHGVTGDSDWYYRDSGDVWSKADATNFTEAATLAVEVFENTNSTDTIEALSTTEWTSSGGMTVDGYFQMSFVFKTPIVGAYPTLLSVQADGVKNQVFESIPVDINLGSVTGSKVEWKIKVSDKNYDYSQVKVYACNATVPWVECTRNEGIPFITSGMDTTDLVIQFKIETPVDFPVGSNIVLTPKIF